MSSTPDSAEAPLATTLALFARLEELGVRYCHWKSTPSLATALAGRTDLDLLVEREDADRFSEAARELGFKPFISHASRRFPAVEDLLGYDAATGRLIHLHVYYQLILGEHYVKNHRLPFERALIASSSLRDGVRVPAPELEVAILALIASRTISWSSQRTTRLASRTPVLITALASRDSLRRDSFRRSVSMQRIG